MLASSTTRLSVPWWLGVLYLLGQDALDWPDWLPVPRCSAVCFAYLYLKRRQPLPSWVGYPYLIQLAASMWQPATLLLGWAGYLTMVVLATLYMVGLAI